PGFITTDMTDRLPQAMLEQAAAAIPLRRLGQAEDVAALTLFLASEQAAYITGEVIRVDGGLYI
ncbi:MAG: SDR family oxidoreductase, partial [Clostridia bacterium]|nr:SDR family oxidoreductase [Clostridia bacterium]